MKTQSIISISLALLLSLPSLLLAETIELNNGETYEGSLTLANTDDYPAVLSSDDGSTGKTNVMRNGTLTLESGKMASFLADGAPLDIQSVITGSGNLSNCFTDSDGTYTSGQVLTLSNKNTYTGKTYFGDKESAGAKVELKAKDAIASSPSVETYAQIDIYADQTINNLSGEGTVYAQVADITLTLNYDTDTQYDGKYVGNGNLEKTGTSTLTVTKPFEHTGKTMVSQGTLKYTGEVSANSPIEVKSGATAEFAQSSNVKFNAGISGDGTFKKSGSGELRVDTTATPVTVKNVEVDAGTLLLNGDLASSKLIVTTKTSTETGQLEIGYSDSSTFLTQSSTVKDLELNSNGTITFDFGSEVGNKPGEYFDTLFATNSAVLNGGTFNFTWAGSSVGGNEGSWQILADPEGAAEMFLLIACDDVVGDLSKITLTGLDNDFWKIQESTKDGVNGVFLMAAGVDPPGPVPPGPTPTGSGVPEPSTWALLILGSIGLMYFKRRK